MSFTSWQQKLRSALARDRNHQRGAQRAAVRLACFEVLEDRNLLSTYTVNSLTDTGTGSGLTGDLRYCINQANANDQANSIVFDSTVFSTPQTITLSGTQLELQDTGGTQTITGPTAGVTISGGGNSRVFEVDTGVTASISGLTISGGAIGYDTSGAGLANYGTATLADCTLSGNSAYDVAGAAGVFNSGTANLTMTDCTVSGNHGYDGGGLANDGTATLTDCAVSDNSVIGTGGGGGVFNYSSTAKLTMTGCAVSGNSAYDGGGMLNYSGTATLIDCTLSDNTESSSHSGGGGLANDGAATLTDCTVSGNSANDGGGVYNDDRGTATLTDCTLSGNSAVVGGGVESYSGLAILTDCTISGNSATQYGGLADLYQGGATLTDTIVAGNTDTSGTSDIGGANVSGSDNLIGTGGSGGLTNGVDGNIVLTSLTNLGLAPLGNFGGPTQTIALLTGSPAIGAGVIADYPGTTTPITTDQRGLPLDSPNPDIGAFQTQSSTLSPLTFSGINSRSITYGTPSVTISGTLADGSQAPVGETVAVTLNGDEQSATIGSGGAFSTTFDTTVLNVVDSPYTITYVYTGDATLAPAGTTSTLTVNPAALTTFTVNSLGDAGTGSGDSGDLRYCISLANADDGANQIVFDPTVFSTPQTITLSGKELELKDTDGTQTITGPAAGVTISGAGTSPGIGGGSSRVFEVDDGVTASISGLTISGGSTYSYPGIAFGGGVLNDGGTVTLTKCTLSGNYASYGAGGLCNSAGGTVTLTDCTLSGNSSLAGAGGLMNYGGTATLTDCTLSRNYGGTTGGLENFGGMATLTDCTVSGNTSNRTGAGGVFNYGGTASLTGCTISGNYGGSYGYGGLVNSASYNLPVGPTTLIDTIVAGNTNSSGVSDIFGIDISGSDNLIGTGGSGGLTSGVDGNIVLTSLTDLGLAALGNNGGPTQTMALLTGSPAIGAGAIADYPGTNTPITADQRGLPLDSPVPDIGAYQTQRPALTPLTFSQISDPSITFGTSSVTISGTLKSGSQAPVDETIAVTLNGDEQSATIDSEGAYSTTYSTTGLTVAAAPYTVSYAYSSDGTFASVSTTSTLTVNPATLTVTADPASKVYGTADPTLAYTATGFEFNDSAGSVLTGALARAQARTLAGEQAGGYTISLGTLAANSNYTISFTGNTLTITPAHLTVVANPQTKVFGSADPTLAFTSSGFQFADTAATVLTGSPARAAGETVSGSPYAINQGTLAANSNYTIQFTGSSLSITPATPAVSVSDPGGRYTGAPIAAQATVTSVSGTAAASLEGITPTLTYYVGSGTSGTDLDAAAPSATGTYTVVARFPGSDDYAAAVSKPATFAIEPASVTIALTSSSGSPAYGQAVTFVATVNSNGGTPGGNVTFVDGTTPLATIPLDGSGQAAVTISTLSLGSQAITATYNGGTDFLGVKSGTTAESVSQSATAIVLVPHAVLKGKKKLSAVGLTAKIEAVTPGGGVPTGQVTFDFVKKHGKKVTVKTLGTAELSGGEASLTLKPNEVLKKTLMVVYSGDPDFLASMMSPPKLTRSGIGSSGY